MTSRIADLLLVEALRQQRRCQSLLMGNPKAMAAAKRHAGSTEEKLLVWARGLPEAASLQRSIGKLLMVFSALVTVLLVVAFVAGLGMASAALAEPSRPVNISWVLISLLGPQLGLLLLWLALLALSLASGGAAPSGVGALSLAGAKLFSHMDSHHPEQGAALRAVTTTLARGPVARWGLSAISHALWLSFSLGALLLSGGRMLFQQFDFVWETTLLSDPTIAGLILSAARLPASLGLAAPDAALLEASRLGSGKLGVGRELWGGFLLSCLLLYGLLPRLLLALLCGALGDRALRRRPIDLADSAFLPAVLELQARPVVAAPQGHYPPDAPRKAGPKFHRDLETACDYRVLLGIELNAAAHWPPATGECRVLALGHVAARADEVKLLAQLQGLHPAPRGIIVACSLARSPDRGVQDFIADLCAIGRPLLVALTESPPHADDGDLLAEREQHWRDCAGRAGATAIARIELQALFEAGDEALERLLPTRGGRYVG